MIKFKKYIDKRFKSCEKMIDIINHKIAKFDKMARILRKSHTTIYNWHYSHFKRRKKQDKQNLIKAKYWGKILESNKKTFQNVGCLASQLKKGRRLMLLSDKEYRLLKYYLKIGGIYEHTSK